MLLAMVDHGLRRLAGEALPACRQVDPEAQLDLPALGARQQRHLACRQFARGGGRGLLDLGAYVETSSYGPRAIDATIRELGIDLVVRGSDLPYAEPAPLDFGAAARHAIQVANPTRLLYGKESSS